jgi:alpha-1,2-mannosyltransferase
MYGSGFQTWEYSPVYAIRSYAYLLLHALVGYPVEFLTHNKVWERVLCCLCWETSIQLTLARKVFVFFAIRTALALFCGLSEYKFYKAIKRNFASPFVATAYAVFSVFSTGMFISSAGPCLCTHAAVRVSACVYVCV